MITLAQLNARLGQSISKICPNGFTGKEHNHCAHFVCHLLEYSFGANCRMMGSGKAAGANIRVQEVFARCPQVGKWGDRPVALNQCLAFVTHASNVNLATKVMANVPKKHVGIYLNGNIWHYSNTQGKVVCVTPDEYSKHYPGAGIGMFYGTFPV